MNESHRKMTVRERLTAGTHHPHGRMHATKRGEVNVVKKRLPLEVYCTWRVSAGSTAAASKCLITRKIMIPPTDSRDPLDGPPYFTKKCFPPDCWDPPATSSHARKCVRAKKTIRPPYCWDPPPTSSHARKCLTIGTHLVEADVALSLWSRTCTYIYIGGCIGAHMS